MVHWSNAHEASWGDLHNRSLWLDFNGMLWSSGWMLHLRLECCSFDIHHCPPHGWPRASHFTSNCQTCGEGINVNSWAYNTHCIRVRERYHFCQLHRKCVTMLLCWPATISRSESPFYVWSMPGYSMVLLATKYQVIRVVQFSPLVKSCIVEWLIELSVFGPGWFKTYIMRFSFD
jgi:hypothetical protein